MNTQEEHAKRQAIRPGVAGFRVADVIGNSSSQPSAGRGIDWARVTGVPQDIEAMQSAYERGGIGYLVGDAVNRGARSFADSLETAIARPIVGGTIKTVGGFGRGLLGLDPASEAASNSTQPESGGLSNVETPVKQNAGFADTRPLPAMRPDRAPAVNNIGSFGGDTDIYANTAPPTGFGRAIYSNSRAGAEPDAFSRGGFFTGMRPFGRTFAQQRVIDDRVGQYERAAETLRSLRGVPSERDRLEARANAPLSLNQGLSSYLQAGGDRRYARERLRALDARDAANVGAGVEQARLGFDMQQAGFSNALEAEKVSQGRYKVTDAKFDPYGEMVSPPAIFDTRTGQYVDQAGIGLQKPQLTREEAMTQATKEADEAMGGISGLFTSEKGVFNGMTKAQYIEQRARQLMGQESSEPPRRARNPETGEVAELQPDGTWRIIGVVP